MKVKITITGAKVKDVGYRAFLLVNALQMGIKNFSAYNAADKEAVSAYAEGGEEQLNTYFGFIKKNYPEKAVVGEIKRENFEGEVTSAREYMEMLQFEQIAKGVPAILNIDKKQDTMLVKQDELKGAFESGFKELSTKQDIMIGKQDELKGAFESGFKELSTKQDLAMDKQDELKETVERGLTDLKEEHIKTRETSKEIFYSEVRGLKQELKSLRSTVDKRRGSEVI